MAYIFGGSYAFGDGSKTVSVSAFYMALTETTEDQWADVYAWAVTNGYNDLPNVTTISDEYTNFPASSVSWYDAVKWCNARSEMESFAPCYTVTGGVYRAGTNTPTCAWTNNGYRLPTEVEWERAARGFISGGVFPWGGSSTNDIADNRANYRNSGDLSEALSKLATPVGGWTYAPEEYTVLLSSMVPSDELFRLMSYLIYPYPGNDYGLYDMSGNVAEWCWDWYTHAGPASGSTNSTGPASGTRRVVRGGHYLSNSTGVSLPRRALSAPDKQNAAIGFRTARKGTP
jgi:formylglycine-generating enzyme required for sulfatase activity